MPSMDSELEDLLRTLGVDVGRVRRNTGSRPEEKVTRKVTYNIHLSNGHVITTDTLDMRFTEEASAEAGKEAMARFASFATRQEGFMCFTMGGQETCVNIDHVVMVNASLEEPEPINEESPESTLWKHLKDDGEV